MAIKGFLNQQARAAIGARLPKGDRADRTAFAAFQAVPGAVLIDDLMQIARHYP
jgi:hypothetical protein